MKNIKILISVSGCQRSVPDAAKYIFINYCRENPADDSRSVEVSISVIGFVFVSGIRLYGKTCRIPSHSQGDLKS